MPDAPEKPRNVAADFLHLRWRYPPGTVRGHGWPRRAYRDVFTACPGRITPAHMPAPNPQHPHHPRHPEKECQLTHRSTDADAPTITNQPDGRWSRRTAP